MRQVQPNDHWPSGEGRVVATVCREPGQLADMLGIRFERGVDGLDHYSLAAIADDAVGQIWLFKHDHGPSGTDIEVDAAVATGEAKSSIRRHLRALWPEVTWLGDEAGRDGAT